MSRVIDEEVYPSLVVFPSVPFQPTGIPLPETTVTGPLAVKRPTLEGIVNGTIEALRHTVTLWFGL